MMFLAHMIAHTLGQAEANKVPKKVNLIKNDDLEPVKLPKQNSSYAAKQRKKKNKRKGK